MDWAPDGSFYVSDGGDFYMPDRPLGARVVKFDKDGNYLLEWGQEGIPPNESRPAYFNNLHGIAVDPATGNVFVNDRQNHRIQAFTGDGEYLHEWPVGDAPSDLHMFIISADSYLWAADRGTNRILKYDLDGNFLYAWGVSGDFPGGMWGVHAISVDSDGNFYVAEVDNGRVQKYRPRPGANPDYLIAPAVSSAAR
jgi:DNA-binding beta-propeller fold protein YncE